MQVVGLGKRLRNGVFMKKKDKKVIMIAIASTVVGLGAIGATAVGLSISSMQMGSRALVAVDDFISAFEEWKDEIVFQKGDKGDKGDKGEKGDQGIQGLQGVQGVQGVQGNQGVQGIQGDKGDKGDQGIQGEKGDQGIQGVQGEKGDQGVQGETGKSAYEIWLELGNEGTEEEFLAWLKGEAGEKGDQGIQGETGVGIEKVEYDENGDLKITFTDGSTQTVVMPDKHIHSFGGWIEYSETQAENQILFRVCFDCGQLEWTLGSHRFHQ